MKWTRIPAGLVDSGFASLATFAVGLYATYLWVDTPETLGVYALFYSSLAIATAITSQFTFIPAEKVTLLLDPVDRILPAPRMLRLGVPVALLAATVALIPAGIVFLQGTPTDVILPLLVTTMAASILSPIQDHTRRLFHLAGRSWTAASVSILQLVGAVAGIMILAASGVPVEYIPLGALTFANASSLLFAWSMDRHYSAQLSGDVPNLPEADAALQHRHLATSGRWLVSTGVMSTGTNLVVAAIVSWLAGQEALGYAEAARVVAQPMLVLAFGLRSVLGPNSMEAAAAGARDAARSVARVFYLTTAALGAAYAVLVAAPWALNPLSRLVPAAYDITGLVLLTIVANGFNGAAFPGRLELIGASRESDLVRAELGANAVQLAAATVLATLGASSLRVGAMARPGSFLVLGIMRLDRYRHYLDRYYTSRRPAATESGGLA
jgi:O-antigen/teichoic acid export membrane protein